MKYCYGVDIGGTTVKIGLFTEDGSILEKWEIPSRTENGGENVPKDIADAVLGKLEERGIAKEDVIGVGLGVPGPVASDGTVLGCANLKWGVFNVNEKMSGLTGLRCVTGNDANVAALGELWKGGAQGCRNIVFVTLGTGVGGGIVCDGRIITGAHGGGGEIGHMVVNPDETAVCGCGGHGHLEQYASATGVVRLAKKALEESGRDSSLRSLGSITAKDVFDAAKAGDALANETVDTMCRYLAQALSGVGATVDPEAFVIGGGVAKAGSIITDRLQQYFTENSLNVLGKCEFRLATLGNDAGMYGAAYLALGD